MPFGKYSAQDLSPARRAAIAEAVKQTACDLLAARDAETVLHFYAPCATVVSNGYVYPSFEAFSSELESFYGSLREVGVAAWGEMRVNVLSETAAVFTGRFSWSSTDAEGERTDLRGTWTAVFVLVEARWRIQVRHESFEPSGSGA
jgi:ketosteroid isomerase-like protein